MRNRLVFIALFPVSFGCILSTALAEEPQIIDGRIVWPKDHIIPRYETEIEKKYREMYGDPPMPRAATPAPSGPLHCVAEYEPMEGILVEWKSFTSIISQMVKEITTTANTIAYVAVDNVSTQSSATTTLTNAGANMSKVRFVVYQMNSVWIRDYGPRYCYEGACRVIVDHEYNRVRPLDNVFPPFFAAYKKNPYYEFQNMYGNNQLIHGGGNYHLDALGRGYATRLTVNENPLIDPVPASRETKIIEIWNRYWGVSHTFLDPFPTSVDSTQHLDMWMQIIGDNKVVISDWPNNPGSTQDNICDNTAAMMAGNGYTVYRVPAFSVSGTHYTYTNVVVCNNLVLVPSYTNATVSPSNATALATWQAAMPGKTVVQINCQAIVTSAGVMHCIAMHVPVPLGGASPTAYLKNYRGGEVLTPGQQININWISDDDVGTSSADLLLSTDGGLTWPTTIAAATADDGSYTWTVPNICAKRARLRVVIHDGDGNTGSDSSTSNLRIAGLPCPGDMNCDGEVDANDVNPMILALTDPTGYMNAYPLCSVSNGDMNNSSTTDGDDLQLFANELMQP